jgi:hypothetical protein
MILVAETSREAFMSKGIKPGHPEEYHSSVPRYTLCDSPSSLNLAATLGINAPITRIRASQVWWPTVWSGAFNHRGLRT